MKYRELRRQHEFAGLTRCTFERTYFMRYVRQFSGLVALFLVGGFAAASEQKLVVADNDFNGPPYPLSGLRSEIMFLDSPYVQVLGFAVVTCDCWRNEEVTHLLRLHEIAGRTDVPVIP